MIKVHLVKSPKQACCIKCGAILGPSMEQVVTTNRDYYDAPPLGYRACNEKKKRKAS